MKKIAIVLGVLFLMGMVVSPVLAQLPGFPGLGPEVAQVAIPDYSQWQMQAKIGFDLKGDGKVDISMAKYVKQEVEEVVTRTGKTTQIVIRTDMINILEFSPTEVLLFWYVQKIDSKEPEVLYAILENGQWKTVSPQAYGNKMMELFQKKGIDPEFLFGEDLIQVIRWIRGG